MTSLTSNTCQPISTLNLPYSLVNLKPELKLGKSVSQSAARIHMMSHYMNKAFEAVPCSSDFHDTLPIDFYF